MNTKLILLLIFVLLTNSVAKIQHDVNSVALISTFNPVLSKDIFDCGCGHCRSEKHDKEEQQQKNMKPKVPKHVRKAKENGGQQ
ncbi:hypothetical protein niasHT_020150 [Heterodera trifolii]|uniref:Secreted protein n=1 Tax=Heterodera trifolii TaxID=157864 RepID=A0ABD2KJA5_9BILA